MGDIISHAVSFLLLALLNCANSVLVRGVYIDAEEPAGQCVIFPVYYVRMFVQKERTRKQSRLMEKLNNKDQFNVQPLLADNNNGKPKPVIVAMGRPPQQSGGGGHHNNNSAAVASKELESHLMGDATVVHIPERSKTSGGNEESHTILRSIDSDE